MRLMKAGRCHQHTSYKRVTKPALRMLNGFLTFHYGALNSSCYDGDSGPGGGLLGIDSPYGAHAHRWTSLLGVTEGLGTGSVRPLFRASGCLPAPPGPLLFAGLPPSLFS